MAAVRAPRIPWLVVGVHHARTDPFALACAEDFAHGRLGKGEARDATDRDDMPLLNLVQGVDLLLTFCFLRRDDWVVSALGPWVTPEDSGESHPAPSEYAKLLYSLVGVL